MPRPTPTAGISPSTACFSIRCKTSCTIGWVARRIYAPKLLRAIGAPEERFAEDHLRMLRAVRFAAQLDFQIEERTFAALRANAPSILTVSAERIREELLKLFRPPHAARGLDLLRDSGLVTEQVLSEIAATIHCQQSADYHPEGSVYNHIRMHAVPRIYRRTLPRNLPWTVLLHDIAKPVTATTDRHTGAIHFYGHEKIGAEMAAAIFASLEIFAAGDR